MTRRFRCWRMHSTANQPWLEALEKASVLEYTSRLPHGRRRESLALFLTVDSVHLSSCASCSSVDFISSKMTTRQSLVWLLSARGIQAGAWEIAGTEHSTSAGAVVSSPAMPDAKEQTIVLCPLPVSKGPGLVRSSLDGQEQQPQTGPAGGAANCSRPFPPLWIALPTALGPFSLLLPSLRATTLLRTLGETEERPAEKTDPLQRFGGARRSYARL